MFRKSSSRARAQRQKRSSGRSHPAASTLFRKAGSSASRHDPKNLIDRQESGHGSDENHGRGKSRQGESDDERPGLHQSAPWLGGSYVGRPGSLILVGQRIGLGFQVGGLAHKLGGKVRI
jgi:hypothetical protein